MQISEPNRFIECIIAPGFTRAAFQLLTTRPTWKKNVRLLRTGPLDWTPPPRRGLDYRATWTAASWCRRRDRECRQRRFQGGEGRDETRSQRAQEMRRPAIRLAGVQARQEQRDRVGKGRHGGRRRRRADEPGRFGAYGRAQGRRACKGAVLASDAFFPFRDNVDEAARAGVTAMVQPGGSMRDADSIPACDEHGLAMVFTGVRHFRH